MVTYKSQRNSLSHEISHTRFHRQQQPLQIIMSHQYCNFLFQIWWPVMYGLYFYTHLLQISYFYALLLEFHYNYSENYGAFANIIEELVIQIHLLWYAINFYLNLYVMFLSKFHYHSCNARKGVLFISILCTTHFLLFSLIYFLTLCMPKIEHLK